VSNPEREEREEETMMEAALQSSEEKKKKNNRKRQSKRLLGESMMQPVDLVQPNVTSRRKQTNKQKRKPSATTRGSTLNTHSLQ
jgi:hypothetical protein